MKPTAEFPFHSTPVEVSIPLTYAHHNPGAGKPLLVFLHGYTDNGASFLRRAFPSLDPRFEILAPNGLFPLPVQASNNIWKPAFAWYFADYAKKRVLIPPQVSAESVLHLIDKLNLSDRPKILVGFSQGGFFLPHLFPKLSHVKKMFAIGAGYRRQDYPDQLPCTLDALHGTDDQIVLCANSKEHFGHLADINPSGVFQEFAGLGHTMNDESRNWLRQKIDEIF